MAHLRISFINLWLPKLRLVTTPGMAKFRKLITLEYYNGFFYHHFFHSKRPFHYNNGVAQ